MRRVDALFGEGWRIVRRAWWPILAVGVLVWSAWSAVCLVLAAVLRFGAWAALAGDAVEASESYPDGIPAGVANDLQRQAEALAADIPTAAWVVAGVVLTLATVLAWAAGSAAVYRLGAEAAAGRPTGFSVAWDGVRCGTARLTGYGLLLGLGSAAVLGVMLIPAIALMDPAPFLGVALLLVGVPAWIACLYALVARLLPGFVQACLRQGSGALRWSWRATRGRFWAVLGRWLLWLLAAGLVTNTVQWVVGFPLSLGMMSAVLAGGSGWVALLLMLLAVVVSGALSSISLIGGVPIWRDLTTDPAYAAINPDGTPVEH
jgi:hypothetical protein